MNRKSRHLDQDAVFCHLDDAGAGNRTLSVDDQQPIEAKPKRSTSNRMRQRIIASAKEPYKTIFALAWCTGLRAGELLGLTRGDLDFELKLISKAMIDSESGG